MQARTINQIDQLFRQSYGHIVSTMVAQYGMDLLDQIENAAMESFYQALKVWPLNGTPDNPKAWLYTVGKRKLIDHLRKHSRMVVHQELPVQSELPRALEIVEIKDPELRLLFTICHPELKPEDQLAFMLKLISGFGIREIANALLLSEEAVKKRLSRARSWIKSKHLNFSWPSNDQVERRRHMVHTALYLLFNEGYYSSHPDQWISREFCLEAMRLCKYLVDHVLANHETHALMSLMCYHISRFEGRTDESDQLILLKDQDRSLWDQEFIRLGHYYLEKSAENSNEKTAFQLEAFISAQHCMAKSLEETDWDMLDLLYTKLHQIKRNDLVLLNLVIVKIQRSRLDEAKSIFELFEPDKMKNYKTTYYLVGAELYRHLKDAFTARMWIEKALEHSRNKREVDFLIKHFDPGKKVN